MQAHIFIARKTSIDSGRSNQIRNIMLLKQWRVSKGLKIEDAAKLLNLSIGGLSLIENGRTFPHLATMILIEGATDGRVAVADHVLNWRRFNTGEFVRLRAQGRAHAAVFRAAVKKVKRGRKAGRRRQEKGRRQGRKQA
jgi:transcriptional regulator with XRE-family HTH domain